MGNLLPLISVPDSYSSKRLNFPILVYTGLFPLLISSKVYLIDDPYRSFPADS